MRLNRFNHIPLEKKYSDLPFGSKTYPSLEIPPNLLYHGFPRRAVEPPRISWLGLKLGKKAYFSFPCRHFFLFGFVYILLIILTIAHLITFTLHLHYPWARQGTRLLALLLLFIIKQRASEQAIIGVLIFHVFLEPARSILTIFFSLRRHWEAFPKTHLCISIGKPDFFATRMACYFSFCLLACFLCLFFIAFFLLCYSAD